MEQVKKQIEELRENIGGDMIVVVVCGVMMFTEQVPKSLGWQVLYLIDAVLVVALCINVLRNVTKIATLESFAKKQKQEEEKKDIQVPQKVIVQSVENELMEIEKRRQEYLKTGCTECKHQMVLPHREPCKSCEMGGNHEHT